MSDSFTEQGNKSWVATAAIAEGLAVKLSAGQVVVATAATDKIVGVTLQKAAAGEICSVRLRSAAGTARGKAGGTIAVGDFLTANGSGSVIATTTAANEVIGRAIEAAASGEFVEFIPANHLYAVT